MAEQIYKQPQRGRRDEESDGGQEVGPQWNSANPDYTPGQRATGAGRSADETLGNIDSLLGDMERGATPTTSTGGASKYAADTPENRAIDEEQEARRRQHSQGLAGWNAQAQAAKDWHDSTDPAKKKEEAGATKTLGSAAKPAEGRTLTPGQVGEAEGSLYNKAGVDAGGVGKGGFLVNVKRRRRLLVAGGAGGGIAGLVISLLLVAPVFRVPALMDEIQDKVGAEVDHIVERRAERIIIRYLIAKAGNGLVSNYVITGSPMHDLWRTFQSRRIEAKIKDRTGISFRQTSDGVVHLDYNGQDLGGVRNSDDVLRLIDRGSIKTKADFKILTKAVLPAVRFHRASIEAKSFKFRFLKGRPYGAPAPEKDQTKSPAENAAKTVEKLTEQQIEIGIEGDVGELGDALSCTFEGEGCEIFQEQDPEANVPDSNSDFARRDAVNGSSQAVEDAVNEGVDEAEKISIKDRTKTFINVLLEKIISKIVGSLAAKIIVAAIPFLGWIDLLATLQHAIANALSNDLVARIPVIMKENAYGAIYSSWVGYGDQQKAGKMPLSEVSALNKQLAGDKQSHDAKEAAAYKYMQGEGTKAGIPVSPRVGSNTYNVGDQYLDNFYKTLGFAVRFPLEVWFLTAGRVFKVVGDAGSDFVSFLMRVSGFTALAESTLRALFGDDWKTELGKFAVRAVLAFYGILIDPLAKGAAMMNNLFVGGDVALNYVCHLNMGCMALTQQQGVFINMNLQKEHDQEMAMTPLKDRLFSMDNSSSLISNLARSAPPDLRPGTVMGSLFGQIGRLPNAVLSFFSPKIRAAEADDRAALDGVQQYGATEDQLNQDIAPEVREQQAGSVQCPKTDPTKEFNVCQADSSVIKSLTCMVDPNCPEFQ